MSLRSAITSTYSLCKGHIEESKDIDSGRINKAELRLINNKLTRKNVTFAPDHGRCCKYQLGGQSSARTISDTKLHSPIPSIPHLTMLLLENHDQRTKRRTDFDASPRSYISSELDIAGAAVKDAVSAPGARKKISTYPLSFATQALFELSPPRRVYLLNPFDQEHIDHPTSRPGNEANEMDVGMGLGCGKRHACNWTAPYRCEKNIQQAQTQGTHFGAKASEVVAPTP
jgi:hypothetical protein